MLKILLCSEFSKLNTGYSNYYRNMAEAFTKEGYKVIELASKADMNHPDHIEYINNCKWKIYPCEPNKNETEKLNLYKDRQQKFGDAVHGGWLYDFILEQDKPDFVISIRDYWYDRFIINSPLSKNTNVILSPTCDSFPQNPEWVEGFNKADGLVFYNEWSENWWKTQSSSNKVLGTISPSAPNCFKVQSKNKTRDKIGVPRDIKLCSTVMRNQVRKRFPELLEAISQSDWHIHLHTSYPDGKCWNLPELIKQYGVENQVFFTYFCKKCESIKLKKYSGSATICKTCRDKMFIPSNQTPLTEENLNDIYSISDLYIQYHNSEGFGIPTIEAGTCGVQTATVDFSAQSDIADKIGSIKLEPLFLQRDYENNCFRAIPDNIKLLDLLKKFDVNYNRGKIAKLTTEAYNWPKSMKKWIEILNTFKIKSKNSEMGLTNPIDFDKIVGTTNEEFVYYCCKYVAQDKSLIGSIFALSVLDSLNSGAKYTRTPTGWQKSPYNKKSAYNEFLEKYLIKKSYEEKTSSEIS